MLKLGLLFLSLIFSQQINAMNSSSEYSHTDSSSGDYSGTNSSSKDSTSSQYSESESSPKKEDIGIQDLRDSGLAVFDFSVESEKIYSALLFEKISVELWKIYCAHKPNPPLKIHKTAWLITLRSMVIPVICLAALKMENYKEIPEDFDLFYLKDVLRRFIRESNELKEYYILDEFDMDNDDRCMEAVSKVVGKSADFFSPHMENVKISEELGYFSSIECANKFFLENISRAVEPVFTLALNELPIDAEFHPFKSDETLIKFYKAWFVGLSFFNFQFLAPYLVTIFPVDIILKNHKPKFARLFAHLYTLNNWPIIREWMIVREKDENSFLRSVLPKELFAHIHENVLKISRQD